jgi:hypothetical protein
MNKYEKHYQSIQTSDLLRKLLEHKLQTQPLSKEWAEALLQVLLAQNLQGKYRKVFMRIQDSDPYQLGEDGQEVNKLIDDLQAEELRDNPFVIDPMKIGEAGRTLRMMVKIVTVLMIFAAACCIFLLFGPDRGSLQTALTLLIIVCLLSTAAALGFTFSAGTILQESVRRSGRSPADKNP